MSEQTQNGPPSEIPANKPNGVIIGGTVARKTKFAPKKEGDDPGYNIALAFHGGMAFVKVSKEKYDAVRENTYQMFRVTQSVYNSKLYNTALEA